jgi:hypothetical protein
MVSVTSGNPVVDAILAKTGDQKMRWALLMGSSLESGWNPAAVGDNNTSFGPFQIHLPVHPGVTKAQAEDPAWAVNYMFGAYQNGVNKVPAAQWALSPAQAAATAAYYAEAPLNMYPSDRVTAAWPKVQSAALGDGGGAVTGGSGNVNSVPNDPTGLLDAVSAVSKALGDFGKSFSELPKVFDMLLKLTEPSTWIRISAAGFGLIFLFVGVFLLGREVIT